MVVFKLKKKMIETHLQKIQIYRSNPNRENQQSDLAQVGGCDSLVSLL